MVATLTSTVAAVIASATAIIASLQATRALQDQARMAIFQKQVDACMDYSKSARAFSQAVNVTVGMGLMRLKDDEPSPEKEKLMVDTITKLQEASAGLVNGMDNVKLVVPDPKVRAGVEAGHQKAVAMIADLQGGLQDPAKLPVVADQGVPLEQAFDGARTACRGYLAEVMSGRQGIR